MRRFILMGHNKTSKILKVKPSEKQHWYHEKRPKDLSATLIQNKQRKFKSVLDANVCHIQQIQFQAIKT